MGGTRYKSHENKGYLNRESEDNEERREKWSIPGLGHCIWLNPGGLRHPVGKKWLAFLGPKKAFKGDKGVNNSEWHCFVSLFFY